MGGVAVERTLGVSRGRRRGRGARVDGRGAGTVADGGVPAGAVVVSGNLPKAGGKYGLYCAVIVKKVDAKTRAATSLNDLLRD